MSTLHVLDESPEAYAGRILKIVAARGPYLDPGLVFLAKALLAETKRSADILVSADRQISELVTENETLRAAVAKTVAELGNVLRNTSTPHSQRPIK